jgi:hypothetical protein
MGLFGNSGSYEAEGDLTGDFYAEQKFYGIRVMVEYEVLQVNSGEQKVVGTRWREGNALDLNLISRGKRRQGDV